MLRPINSIKCTKCGLHYNERDLGCSHCAGVSKKDAVNLKDTYFNKVHDLNRGLIFNFKILFVLALVLFLVAWF
jgi:hypothetical protein